MNRAREVVLCLILLTITASRAAAQQTGAPWNMDCEQQERENEHYTCRGQVTFAQGETKLYADELEWFRDEDRAIARGNVVFSQGRNQISADHADFNTRTRLGTFYRATGFASSKPLRQAPAAPGAFVAPQITGQDTDVYFFGDVIEKVGAKKYTITNGGFTTCVQPTPRWDLHAGKIALNVDDYTLLRNAVFNVKGVPLLYLPIVYYPTNEANRSTGFLLPTVGGSSVKGTQIDNQFFWAIDRSQDASVMYDWYSKFGHGIGSEYRYNIGSGVGNFTTYMLNRKAVVDASGTTSPSERSVNFVGAANQRLPHRLRASAATNYFSSVSTNQAFQTNVADFSRSQRTYGGNVAGAWGHYSLNGTFQRSEWFSNPTRSGVTGSSPLVAVGQSERPLFSTSPIYFSWTSEYAHLDHLIKDGGVVTDNGDTTLSRAEFAPRVRYPLKRWQFLTVNSSVTWRDTFYTRSQDPTTISQDPNTTKILDDNLNRRYVTLQTDLTGPVFNRVWETPDSGYAEKIKHTIEPFLSVQRTTAIDNFNRVVSGVDQPVTGGTTNYAYGVNNRLYAKRKIGQVSQSQEIASLAIGQTYYTNSLASQSDTRYSTSSTATPPSNFSPVRIDARVSPTSSVSGSLQAEIDPTYLELRRLSAGGRHSWSGGTTDVSWNQQFFIGNLPGFNNPDGVSRTLAVTSTAHTRENRYGGTYGLTYDAVKSTIIQQVVQAYYSAQCCGVSLQYSRRITGNSAIPVDAKFMFSFTLAGLGSFAPFDGGMGGVPR
jgi:LPS-assembly protein